MGAFISAWARFVVRQRIALIIGTFIIVFTALFTGGSIPFDNSTQRYFIPGDPTLLEYQSLYDDFGDIEYLIVGIEATGNSTDVFAPETLEALEKISEFLEFHPYVTQLRSLSNYQYIQGDDSSLSTEYLIDDFAALAGNEEEVARVKSVLASEELALGSLITEDFRHTRIIARVEYREDTSATKIELTQDLYAFVEAENLQSPAYNLHLSGYPVINERFETLAAEDIGLLIPIMFVVMVTILYLCFRSLAAVVFPWLVIAGGLLLLLEIQYYTGIPHTTVDSGALPVTMIIIGIGISVHVLLEFFHYCLDGNNGQDAARKAIENIWLPALFTAITTSAGFLALSATRLQPLREFALLGAIGPLLLFLFALTVLPAALSFLRTLPGPTAASLGKGFIARFTNSIPDFTQRNRNAILIAGGLIILFSAWSLPQVRVDTNYITLFKEDSQTRQDILYLDETFKGVMTLDMVLDSGAENAIYEPEFLRKLDAIESWLGERETLGPINSLADYLKEMNMALNDDSPEFFTLPESREMAAQLLLLYDSAGPNEDLSDIKDFDNRLVRLIVPVVNMPASEMEVEMELIRSYMNENYGELQPVLTGTIALLTEQQIYTAEGMVSSFLIALGVITLFFIILFRSLRYGLLSIVPSVIPIVLAAGMAGFLGVYLDQSTMIVFAMTMGLAVDDAIHVMSRYLSYKKTGASTKTAITHAMNESGRAVLFTSVVLVFGFAVLCFGSFTTVVNVGVFGSIIMTLALLGDLIFLPAILFFIDGDDEEEEAIEDCGQSGQNVGNQSPSIASNL